jgi:hypothetical protein
MTKKERAKAFARRVGGGKADLKQTAVAAGAGGGTYAVHTALAKAMPTVFGHWLWGPVLVMAGGHLASVKPKLRTAGHAMTGAGGYALAMAVHARQLAKKAAEAAGLQDVGGLQDAGDVVEEEVVEVAA